LKAREIGRESARFNHSGSPLIPALETRETRAYKALDFFWARSG